MSDIIVSTLNASFSSDDKLGDNAGNNKIILQQMTEYADYFGRIWARCFPSSGVSFTASVGTVEIGEVRVQTVSEGLKFSNSSSAPLKYPGATNVVIDSTNSVLMMKSVDNYGNTIIKPAIGVTLHYDTETASVIAKRSGYEEDYILKPVNIYGACFVSYSVSYLMLYYKPGMIRTPFADGSSAFSFMVGTLFGYNNYDVASLNMKLLLDSSKQWVEFARITSKIVLDAKGVWEFPPNWESTYQNNKEKVGDAREDYPAPGVFEGYSYEIDQYNSFVDTRVHLIIEVNTIGTLRYRDYDNGGDGYWAWFAPYFGSSTWIPKYEGKWTDPPGGKKASTVDDFKYDLNHRTWRDVFLEVDKNELKDTLEDIYEGVVFS